MVQTALKSRNCRYSNKKLHRATQGRISSRSQISHPSVLPLIITITIYSNVIGALAALFFTNHSAVLIGQCNQTVGCNRAVEISNHAQSFQPNPPITELITTTATTTYPKKMVKFPKLNFSLRLCLYHRYLS